VLLQEDLSARQLERGPKERIAIQFVEVVHTRRRCLVQVGPEFVRRLEESDDTKSEKEEKKDSRKRKLPVTAFSRSQFQGLINLLPPPSLQQRNSGRSQPLCL